MNEIPSRGSLTEGEEDRTVASIFEEILEKKLEDIATLLHTTGDKKSKIYEDIIDLVDRSLFRIALKRCNHVKTSSAAYLGIGRNTFQKKMAKLGLDKENNT